MFDKCSELYAMVHYLYMKILNIKSVKTHFQNPIGWYNLFFEKLSQEILPTVLENHMALKIFKIKENPQVINLSEKQANYSCVINVLNYMLWYITYMRIWNM